MGPEAAESRQASATFTLLDAKGEVASAAHADAVIDDDRAAASGPLVIAYLDADALRADDYRLEIDLWPGGRLVLTGLGRRFETFARALARRRGTARASPACSRTA